MVIPKEIKSSRALTRDVSAISLVKEVGNGEMYNRAYNRGFRNLATCEFECSSEDLWTQTPTLILLLISSHLSYAFLQASNALSCMNLNDKVVWITGASSGIGEEMTYLFAHEGATLIISARREAELIRVKGNSAHPDKVRTSLDPGHGQL